MTEAHDSAISPADDDHQIALALGQLPAASAPADLAERVLARLAARRRRVRAGGWVAAAVLVLLSWSFWPSPRDEHPGATDVEVAAHGAAGNKGLASEAQLPGREAAWDALLDEAGTLPSPVVNLDIHQRQQAWTTALEAIARR